MNRTELMNSSKLWVSVGVALVVAVCAAPGAAQSLVLPTTSLSFNTFVGTNPAPQTFYTFPSTAGTPFNPTVAATTNNGGNWLSLSMANGSSQDVTLAVTVQVNTTGLTQGFYTGQVTVTQTGLTGSPGVVAISLQVFTSGSFDYVVSPQVLDVSTQAGVNANSQYIVVSTLGAPNFKPTVTATTSSGGSWLAVAAPVTYTFNTNATVQVNFNTASLAQGFYGGTITVTATGVLNAPVTIPVNLTVGTATTGPSLAVTPTALGLTETIAAGASSLMLAINNGGQGTIAPSATAYTTTGGNWLSVVLGSPGVGGGVIASVTVDDTGLAAGVYQGVIGISDVSSPNSPVMVPVTLTVQTGTPVLAVSKNSVTFSIASGGQSSVLVNVLNNGSGTLNYTATASVNGSTGNWLSVTPASGQAPGILTILANGTSLAPGVFTGQVVVAIPNAPAGSQSPQTIAITLSVGVPAVGGGGVVNGANFTSTTLAPGEIASVFGVNLGPTPGQNTQAQAGALPTVSNGVSATFDTHPAPLYYVSANQMNVQVPFEVAGQAHTSFTVTVGTESGPPYVVPLQATDPAVFMANGRMAILNAAGQQITASNPAHAGDILSMYANGLGVVTPSIASGLLVPTGTLYNTLATATITVGGQSALVSFAGLAPTFAGLYQVNFTVPSGLTAGDNPLTLSIGGNSTTPAPLAVH